MRETIKDYETVEKEREVVYCDLCAGDCTDDFEVQPMELCSACREEEEYEWSLREYINIFKEEEVSDETPFDIWEVFVVGVMFFPLVLPFSIIGLFEEDAREEAFLYLCGVVGTSLWGYLLMLLIFF